LGKHTLEIEYDYNFLLIGISSHEKDYRICWALNNKLGINLTKQDSLEIKDKKQSTPSHFSFFRFEDEDAFAEYSVIANFSESKVLAAAANTLFGADERDPGSKGENELLIPEQRQMNYFFVVRAELQPEQEEEMLKQIKQIDIVLTAIRIDANSLKSKQNLIF
jgi:hypothetical protein